MSTNSGTGQEILPLHAGTTQCFKLLWYNLLALLRQFYTISGNNFIGYAVVWDLCSRISLITLCNNWLSKFRHWSEWITVGGPNLLKSWETKIDVLDISCSLGRGVHIIHDPQSRLAHHNMLKKCLRSARSLLTFEIRKPISSMHRGPFKAKEKSKANNKMYRNPIYWNSWIT